MKNPIYPINGFINGNQKNIKTIKLVESFMNNSKNQIKKILMPNYCLIVLLIALKNR